MLLAALFAVAQQPADAADLEPRACEPERIAAAFPAVWKLPREDRRGAELPSRRFERETIRLAREPFARAADGTSALTLGDLLLQVDEAGRGADLKTSRRQVESVLGAARARVPASLWPQVEALLDVRDFISPKWDPDDDERDGFLMGERWVLPADCWPSHDGGRTVAQCAVLVAADLACIKLAEHDFPNYLRYPGGRYERVAGVPDTFLFVPLADRQPVAGLPCVAAMTFSMDMESDLPFPFGGYAMRLRVLTELDDEGRAVTWVWSDSTDFHWMAGYDRYEPVFAADGSLAGTLILRQTGLDLDGVPDSVGQREGGMRSGLGGVRRRAEEIRRQRLAAESFPASGAIPLAPLAPVAER